MKERKPYYKMVRIPVAPPGYSIKSAKDYDRKIEKTVIDDEGDKDDNDNG